jgi:hypothetical protein
MVHQRKTMKMNQNDDDSRVIKFINAYDHPSSAFG